MLLELGVGPCSHNWLCDLIQNTTESPVQLTLGSSDSELDFLLRNVETDPGSGGFMKCLRKCLREDFVVCFETYKETVTQVGGWEMGGEPLRASSGTPAPCRSPPALFTILLSAQEEADPMNCTPGSPAKGLTNTNRRPRLEGERGWVIFIFYFFFCAEKWWHSL